MLTWKVPDGATPRQKAVLHVLAVPRGLTGRAVLLEFDVEAIGWCVLVRRAFQVPDEPDVTYRDIILVGKNGGIQILGGGIEREQPEESETPWI
jgi:hypothetical protein